MFSGHLGANALIAYRISRQQGAIAMQEDHIYRVIELAGTSDKSVEDAVSSAIARANQTIRNLRWFEIVQTRGHIENGKIGHFQVTLKVGFTMEGAH